MNRFTHTLNTAVGMILLLNTMTVTAHAQSTPITIIERSALAQLPMIHPSKATLTPTAKLLHQEEKVAGISPTDQAEKEWNIAHTPAEGWIYWKGNFEAKEPYGNMKIKRTRDVAIGLGIEVLAGAEKVIGTKDVYGPLPPGETGLYNITKQQVWEWPVPVQWQDYYADSGSERGTRFGSVYLTPTSRTPSNPYPSPVLLCFDKTTGLHWQTELPLQQVMNALPTPPNNADFQVDDDWHTIGTHSRYNATVSTDGKCAYAVFNFPRRGVSVLFLVGINGVVKKALVVKGWHMEDEDPIPNGKIVIKATPFRNADMYPELRPETELSPTACEMLLIDGTTFAMRRIVDRDDQPIKNFGTNFNDTFGWTTLYDQGTNGNDAYLTYNLQ